MCVCVYVFVFVSVCVSVIAQKCQLNARISLCLCVCIMCTRRVRQFLCTCGDAEPDQSRWKQQLFSSVQIKARKDA